MFLRRAFALALSSLGAWGCNAPEPPASSGGTDQPPGPCGRGVLVAHTDFQSTNVALVAFDGEPLSPTFFSSATSSVGLSAPLSGDVVLPTAPLSGAEITLIDRYPASVLSWVSVETGSARAQLDVGERTNPHDYVQLSDDKAYVSRFEADDIAIVDPLAAELVGQIDLMPALSGQASDFGASPGRMLALAGRVYVVLEGFASGFSGSAPARVVELDSDTDSISDVLVLPGVHGCAALAVSPDESELALGCAGVWSGSSDPDPATSFVVRVAIGAELTEIARYAALGLGGAPFGFGIDYASDQALVVTRFGNEAGRPDTLLELSLSNGASRELLSTEAFELGDVRCAAECGVCFATDASRGVVHRFEVEAGRIGAHGEAVADYITGLPPRWLGRF